MTIRVVHVLEALEGGTARHLVDVVRYTPGVDHHVVIPTSRVGGVTDTAAPGAMAAAGATLHHVEMRRDPRSPRNVAALVTVRSLIRRAGPDIVHGHSSIGGVVARVAAIRTPAATVYTPNGIAPGRGPVALERLLGRITDRFVAVSRSEGDEALRLGLVAPSRLVVIPNGIDPDAIGPDDRDLRALASIPADAPLVGSIARLIWQKDPEEFVRVCAAVHARRPDVHFLLIGDGPLRAAVDAAVGAAGLAGRWHHLASLPNAAGVLGQLDVLAITSRFEGGPYAPLEAMRAGTPVVLSGAIGNTDVVEHGVSGAVVPVGATAEMAAEIVGLLDDPDRARAWAGAARTRLRTRFGSAAMGEALARLYQELVRGRGRAQPVRYDQPGDVS